MTIHFLNFIGVRGLIWTGNDVTIAKIKPQDVLLSEMVDEKEREDAALPKGRSPHLSRQFLLGKVKTTNVA
ncbi:hypothetical protein AWQ23_10500 [Picosynechococcus sp. PCC 73109]|nr:hypothetical protein AWQ23_10500 [Picosynechococcus sp. PCC 73109]